MRQRPAHQSDRVLRPPLPRRGSTAAAAVGLPDPRQAQVRALAAPVGDEPEANTESAACRGPELAGGACAVAAGVDDEAGPRRDLLCAGSPVGVGLEGAEVRGAGCRSCPDNAPTSYDVDTVVDYLESTKLASPFVKVRATVSLRTAALRGVDQPTMTSPQTWPAAHHHHAGALLAAAPEIALSAPAVVALEARLLPTRSGPGGGPRGGPGRGGGESQSPVKEEIVRDGANTPVGSRTP